MKSHIRPVPFLLTAALLVLALTACSDDEQLRLHPDGDDPVGQQVQFACGVEGEDFTRAAISALPDESHFVCKMYYHAKSTDTDASDYAMGDTLMAWLQVDGNVGNSLYWKNTYPAKPTTIDNVTFDDYGFVDCRRLTWRNRMNHLFYAYTDLNHPSLKAEKASTELFHDAGLKLGELEWVTRDDGTHYFNRVWVASNSEGNTYSSMAQQPDPAIAVTLKKPAAGTPEGNRVTLTFHHMLSQVQVNLKNAEDNSVKLEHESSILGVELLGVSQQAFVPTMPAIVNNSQGAFYGVTGDIVASGGQPTWAKKPRNERTYTKDELMANEYASSFSMFRNTSAIPTDYLSHFEGIAFGTLNAIRITWQEETTGNTKHSLTYVVPDTDGFNILKSGTKYIFNIELRRATLYVISTEIVPWTMYTTYNTGGSQLVQ